MKNRNLIILMILIIVWSLFYGVYKYFMWGVFKTDIITLQYISGYLSLGTIGAYIIGGLLYELVREKKYHLITSLGAIITLLSIFLFSKINLSSHYLFVSGVTLILGFFYGLWGVLRNIMISTQIHESTLGDTKINGMANIFFITSIIIGSILGGKIAEMINVSGIFIIISIIFIGLIAGYFYILKKQEQTKTVKVRAIEYKNNYLRDFVFIVKKYFIIMLFVSLLITIGTILSQKAIEYNVNVLHKSGSTAAVILLYSAIGSIIGNIGSMKINSKRWHFFLIFSILFSISCFLFPVFIVNFTHTSILAFVAGLFFGITYNLLEADFFKNIALDDKKSYGSATLGIITSSTIAGLMFLIDIIDKIAGFNGVYYFMGSIIMLIGITVFIIKKPLN